MMKKLIIFIGIVATVASLQAELKMYGGHSMVKPLRTVLVKRPDSAFAVSDPVRWHYTSSPDLKRAQQEHDTFVQILKNNGASVIYHDAFLPDMADAIFVHDPVLMTDLGAIILNMGKSLRHGEPDAIEQCFKKLEIPIYARITGTATVEGGDCLWLDERTLVVGHSFRTNVEGIIALVQIFRGMGVTVLPVQLPFYQGKDSCLHLQSLISIVDEKVAVVYKPLIPVVFIQELEMRGFTLIDVPDSEFLTMGPNILALRPGVCLTIEGNPVTKKRLEDAGIKVFVYRGDEISHKAEGGATCLTRPLLRA